MDERQAACWLAARQAEALARCDDRCITCKTAPRALGWLVCVLCRNPPPRASDR